MGTNHSTEKNTNATCNFQVKQSKQNQDNQILSAKMNPPQNFTWSQNQPPSSPMLGISLVIARNKQGKLLAVKECCNKGWWLPGGLVDPPEDFVTAGVRETLEEGGINVQIKGVLRIEMQMTKSARYKVVFYAEPIDENQKPKSVADYESEEARWVSIQELQELGKKPPYLRGNELLHFGQYLEAGGIIYPLSIIDSLITVKRQK